MRMTEAAAGLNGVAVTAGTFHGIGLGPGDPELLTVKAVRLIAETPVIAYFAKKGRGEMPERSSIVG